ncbi:DNA invertase Pin-like site-specific DNA recombinase [Arthrobacter globiformis]|nr:DNA invertase Pin-like site-specific DNA recombinase [Arthrobacter globiformis]
MSGQRIGYVRVSTLDQNEKRQLEGQILDRVFTDKASGRDTARPQLVELLRFARDGTQWWCTAWTVSPATWTTCVPWCKASRAKESGWSSSKRAWCLFTGEDSPIANLMLSVMGAFAESNCSLIWERQREGIALAQQRGAYKGRKKTLTPERAAELVERAGSGVPKVVLARDYGIRRETAYQYLRQAQPE